MEKGKLVLRKGWVKRLILHFSLGVIGLVFHRLYNIEALRPTLKDVGLLVEGKWIPVELKPVGDEEVGYCPKCGQPLATYSKLEGGWCPSCLEWWPADIVEDWMEENE